VLLAIKARHAAAQDQFADLHARFLNEAGECRRHTVRFCVGGKVAPLARAQQVAATWNVAVEMLQSANCGATFRDRVDRVGRWARDQATAMLRQRPWEASSTDQVDNILARAEASGLTETVLEIIEWVEWVDREAVAGLADDIATPAPE
jgi:hypothetical protein